MLVIDAANVIGSRADGWWSDRPGAARRFTQQVRASVIAGQLDAPVTIVLEGRFRAGVDEGVADGVEVVHAPGEGDEAIVECAERWCAECPPVEAQRTVIVVTADRDLGERVRAVGAEVVGPGRLLDRLTR
jgi:hypothetical protein